jgi:hypothetical protein
MTRAICAEVRYNAHFAAFLVDFRRAIFRLLVSRETGVGCGGWGAVSREMLAEGVLG